MVLIHDGDIGTNASIFVENGSFDRGALTHSEGDTTALSEHGGGGASLALQDDGGGGAPRSWGTAVVARLAPGGAGALY